MKPTSAIRAIENKIGHKRLVWVGTRGTDAQPLLQIQQLSGVFGLVAPLGVTSWLDGCEAYLENLSGTRVDLNNYSVDHDNSGHAWQFHRYIRKALTPHTLLVAYRPTAFLAAACYPRVEYATYLGVFHGFQTAYEHKPWVETELASMGIKTIPWRYFCDDDRTVMLEWMQGRSCVIRANYSDGGAGLTLFRSGDNQEIEIPPHSGGFLAVAPLLEPSVPLNVSGCVFRDGTVNVRHPSLQLIGIPSCTRRTFGYCGNDFATVASMLGGKGISDLEEIAKRTGAWLYTQGYIGAFGVDALLYNNEVYLTEINPRFQGSSAAAAMLSARIGMGDIYIDTLCALLGLDRPQPISLWEQATEQAKIDHRLCQVVCYNTGSLKTFRNGCCVPDLEYGEVKCTPNSNITVLPEAMLFKIFVHNRVTETGLDLPEWLVTEITRLTSTLYG
ncbi:MAG: ATP-grasp domain-containing protein [Syntrophales bacterium]